MTSISLHKPTFEELTYRAKLMEENKALFPKEIWEEWYNDWIRKPKNRYYAYIKVGKDFVGYLAYFYSESENEYLVNVFIEEKYRRHHYGERALRKLLDYCFKKMKFASLVSSFPASRDDIFKFYNKLGFKPYKENNGLVFLRLNYDDYLIYQGINEEYKLSSWSNNANFQKRILNYFADKFSFGVQYSSLQFHKIISSYLAINKVNEIKNGLLEEEYFSYDSEKKTLFRKK